MTHHPSVELSELRTSRSWRTAVWSLRVGYAALILTLAGLITLISGSTPWLLAIGVISWLICALVLATGFLLTLHGLTAPHPGFWEMRVTLIRDTVRHRPPRLSPELAPPARRLP